MKAKKINVAILFLGAVPFYFGQEIKRDSIKKEKTIDGIQIKGSTNKKTETAVLQDIKKSIIQKQSIGAEEISRKGISNVEQGLTKIAGITTVEGKGLFVRGLEERYNYLLVNGLGSPSNNPFQKIIALNQFPTDVVGKLNIYKTFNSNLYGDFAGATFDIETLTIDKSFSKIEFGIGINTLSNFRNNFKVAQNTSGMKGYLGLNSQDRNLPEILRNTTPTNYNFTKDQSINDFKDSWNVDNIKSLPNTNLGFTTAQKIKLQNNANIGFLLSLNQGTKYKYRDGAKNQFLRNGNEIILNNLLNRKQYEYDLESSILLGLSYSKKSTSINLNAIYLQNAINSISDFVGYKNQEIQNPRFFRVNQLDISRFLDLQLTASQKLGERHQLKAGVSYVMNNYAQPDRKIYDGQIIDNTNNVRINYGGNNLIRQYLDVNGKFYASAYGEYSVFLGEKGDNKNYPWQVSLGYNGFADIRKNSYRFIYGKLDDTRQQYVTINKDLPQNTFNQSILSGAYHYVEGSNEKTYNTSLYQFVNAGYINVDFKPNDSWDILLGARLENNLNLSRYFPQASEAKINQQKNQNYFLPSFSIKKAINPKSNLRLAISKTITRPILIESMFIEYINPDNENLVGNPKIQNSENYNLDLKWEYYPTNKEMFAINFFAKRLDKAIERSFLNSGNSNGITITYYNAKKADLAGIELEGIINLSRLSEALNRWSIGANATFMYTNVERSSEQLVLEKPNNYAGELRKRKLQGAAPYTINADLKYEFKNKKNLTQTASLVYNVSGSKIYGVGTAGIDHIYERPFHQLDLIYQNQITKNWNIKLGIINILDSTYKLEVGKESYLPLNTNNNFTHTNFKRGITFNATIGYTF